MSERTREDYKRAVSKAVSLQKEAEQLGDVEAAKHHAEAAEYLAAEAVELFGAYQTPAKKEDSAPGYLDSALQGLSQGSTYMLADEVGGALGSAASGFEDGAYTGIRDNMRQAVSESASQNPLTHYGSEIFGSMLPTAKLLKMAPRATPVEVPTNLQMAALQKLTQTGRLVAAGGVGGGIAGAGSSDDKGLGLLTDVAVGTGLGAGLAPFGAYLGNKIGDIGSSVYNNVKGRLFENSEEVAGRAVRTALDADGYRTADDIIKARAREGGDNLRLFELGPNTTHAGVVASKNPGAGKQVAEQEMKDLQRGQSGRLEESIRETVEPKWGGYHEFKNKIHVERKEQAKPYYDSAYSQPFDPTDRLLRVQKVITDGWPEVIEEAQKRLTRKADLDPQGNVGSTGNFLALADQVKRVLDDKISVAMRNGENEAAADLLKVKKAWTDELDSLIPDYATARGIYAGSRQMDHAADLGKEILGKSSISSRDLTEMLKNFGKGEMDAFRIGLVEGAVNKIELTTGREMGDASRRLFPNTRSERIFDQAYPDGQPGKLREVLEVEGNRSATKNKVTGGSHTFELGQGEKVVGEGRETFTGIIMDGVRRMFGDALNPEDLKAADYERISRTVFGDLSDDEIISLMSKGSNTAASPGMLSEPFSRTGTYMSGKTSGLDL